MGQAELDRFVGRELDGRYRVEEVIGTGGFGAVYRGVGLRLPVPVAIKVLGRPGVYGVRPAGHARRFELEARTTCLLQHPHIVRVFDFGATDDGLLYIVMEHLRGETLGALVARLGSLPVDRACGVAAQIALALAEAHGRGIVHRDLKPGNVMLLEARGLRDHVKVLDFGIAKILDPTDEGSAATMTTASGIVGTPRYISPEQALSAPIGPAADLYGLGVILFEMLTGRPPFDDNRPLQLLQMHAHWAPPALGDRFPAPLRELVAGLLAKDPAARPGSGDEVAAALSSIARSEQAGTLDVACSTVTAAAPARRSRAVAWLGAAVGCAALGYLAGATVQTPAAAGVGQQAVGADRRASQAEAPPAPAHRRPDRQPAPVAPPTAPAASAPAPDRLAHVAPPTAPAASAPTDAPLPPAAAPPATWRAAAVRPPAWRPAAAEPERPSRREIALKHERPRQRARTSATGPAPPPRVIESDWRTEPPR